MSEPGGKPGGNPQGPQGIKAGGHNLNPGDIHEFNPQPDIPGNQAMPGGGGGDPAMLKPDGGDPAMFKPDTGDPGATVEGAQPHMQPGGLQSELGIPGADGGSKPAAHMGGFGGGAGRLIGLLLGALLLGFGFLFFGPPQMVMGFFGLFGGGTLCQGPGGTQAGNGELVPAVLVESAPGLQDIPGGASSGNPDFLTGLVMSDNGLRLALNQGLLVPAVHCGSGEQTMSAPFGGLSTTPTPAPTEMATEEIPLSVKCNTSCSSDLGCAQGFVCLPFGKCWQQACDARAVPTLVPTLESTPPPADTSRGGGKKNGGGGGGGKTCPGGGTHC